MAARGGIVVIGARSWRARESELPDFMLHGKSHLANEFLSASCSVPRKPALSWPSVGGAYWLARPPYILAE